MSEIDPRALLVQAQSALSAANWKDADQRFAQAAIYFAGPDRLLGAGHGWRGQAQVAISKSRPEIAESCLTTAEQFYKLGEETTTAHHPDLKSLQLDLVEGQATCRLMRADLALRRQKYAVARELLDSAYPLYKQLKGRASRADLWSTTARLAQREGRWFSARTAWTQVRKVRRESHDERGECDAMIRLAECLIVEDETDKAEELLLEAEALARELRDSDLRGRVHIAMAQIFEHRGDWAVAWEKWEDALSELSSSTPLLRGLASVRMSRAAAHYRPHRARELLETGLLALLEGEHPDAIGLVLHQLAVVELTRSHAGIAVLAAAGAEAARGGWDPSVQAVFFRALIRQGSIEAAYYLALRNRARAEDGAPERFPVKMLLEALPTEPPPLVTLSEIEQALTEALGIVLKPLAHRYGLSPAELGSQRAAAKLLSNLASTGTFTPKCTQQLVWEGPDGVVVQLPLFDGTILLGRGRENTVQIGWDKLVSRHHSAIEVNGETVTIKDLGSQHGTFVDGKKLSAPMELHEDHTIRLGDTEFSIQSPPASGSAAIAIASAAPD